MGYYVQVIGPTGRRTFLRDGREVELGAARWYPHPSAAQRAADAHQKRCAGQKVIVCIIHTNEVEK